MRMRFVWGVLLVGCGAASADTAAPPPPSLPPTIAKGNGNAVNGSAADNGALGALSLRALPNQSLAYRVKTKNEQPGRKIEQDFVVYVDAWTDGTLVVARSDGEDERSVQDRELEELLPLPEGAQSSYTRTDADMERRDSTLDRHFERTSLGGGREQISWRIERKRASSEEITTGTGVFDTNAMRYERATATKRRKFILPPGSTERGRETKQETEVVYDAEAATARTKERATRREAILKAAHEPLGTANPAADLAAALNSGPPENITLEFHLSARPSLVWKTVLASQSLNDRIRGLYIDRPVPDDVLENVRAAVRKSPSHPIAYLVVTAADPRLGAEIQTIAKRHEDETVREAATERLKQMKRKATPLAARLKSDKFGGRKLQEFESYMLEVDPERDRAALFDHLVPRLRTASEEERGGMVHALTEVAKTSIGDDPEAWARFWETHKAKPYDDWLIEVLATDKFAGARDRAADALAERPITDASRKALRAALEDKAAHVRLSAAMALAKHRDEVAIKPLVRALADDALRWQALLGLAHFSDSALGLNPEQQGKPELTLAALGRWVGWAKRRGIEPGFP